MEDPELELELALSVHSWEREREISKTTGGAVDKIKAALEKCNLVFIFFSLLCLIFPKKFLQKMLRAKRSTLDSVVIPQEIHVYSTGK